MKRHLNTIIKQWFNCIVAFLFLASLSQSAAAQEVYVCVWRNPERTMSRLFPNARDYRTVTHSISPAQLEKIESRLGSAVLPGQREQFQYFEMIDADKQIIGYTLAVTQKGEFGAIEFVFALDTSYSITGMYIQRSRERDTQFKEKSFLTHFVGTSITDAEKIHDPLGKNGVTGTRAVVQGLRKELITLDELSRNANQ